ncbi:MAG TPA: hypothetical protein V6D17_17595 [Candidatus Obscuribacterales bacterium]
MAETAHRDPAKGWIIFFFICFAIVVFAIGAIQLIPGVYDANPPEPTVTKGGGH